MTASYTEKIIEILDGLEFKSVFEPACGDGQNLKAIKEKWPEVEVGGFDLEDKWKNNIADITKDWKMNKDVDVVLIAATLILFEDLEVVVDILRQAIKAAKKYVVLVEVQIDNGVEEATSFNGSHKEIRVARDYMAIVARLGYQTIKRIDLLVWPAVNYLGQVILIKI